MSKEFNSIEELKEAFFEELWEKYTSLSDEELLIEEAKLKENGIGNV